MTKTREQLKAFIHEEALYAEQHKDAPEKPGTVRSRPGLAKDRILSVRLSDAESAALERLASEKGVPASTLVRSWISQKTTSRSTETTDIREIAAALESFSKTLAAL